MTGNISKALALALDLDTLTWTGKERKNTNVRKLFFFLFFALRRASVVFFSSSFFSSRLFFPPGKSTWLQCSKNDWPNGPKKMIGSGEREI